jgi:putative MATE family efflux protein
VGKEDSAIGRDWTTGSIVKNFLSLSFPLVINYIVHLAGPLVPMIWVGRIGAASVAGLGVANSLAAMLSVSGMTGITIGTRALVSRYSGASDAQTANHVARQAFFVIFIYSAIVTTMGLVFSRRILSLYGLSPEVVEEGVKYMRIQSAGVVIVASRYLAEGIMQSSGDTVTPMKIAIFFRGFHVVLCPFLVLGWWIFPRLGVAGAAISDVLSHGLGLILALWILFSGRTRLKFTLSGIKIDPGIMWRIVRVGIPASVMGIQKNLGQLTLAGFMAPFGTLAVAAHSIVSRIEMILSGPSTGAGTAAGVLVGHNLGAGKPQQAEKSGWLSLGLVECFAVICSVVILFYPSGVSRIFTTDSGVIELASIYLKIAAAGFMIIGFDYVLQQSIAGAGDTLPPMIVSLIGLWLIQVPLSYFLPRWFDIGVYGVRWAMVLGTVVNATIYAIYFKVGKWKHKKV